MLRFVCLALFVCYVSAGTVKFADCGQKEVTKVDVSQCDSEPCVIHKGQDLKIEVVFTANQDTEKATIELLAKVGELEIQVPGVDTDGCNNHGLECPLKKGETYTLSYDIFIPKLVPTIESDVTAKLVGDNGILACGTVHGSIVD